MASQLTADRASNDREAIDKELTRIAAQRRHAELHGWHATAESHRKRLDLLLDQRRAAEEEACN